MITEIVLNGTLNSDLNWSEQKKLACSAEHILWNIDLGLFSRLPKPLSSMSQYNSLKLSLEHFCNTLWNEFSEKTVGLCLYKGSADFSRNFPWDEEQQRNFRAWLERGHGEVEDHLQMSPLYCRDVGGEYLDLLAGYLPEKLEAYINLDTDGIEDPLQIALLTTKERYPHLKMMIDGKLETETSVGVCFPAMDIIQLSAYKKFPAIFQKLKEEGTPYRLIPEAFLTSEWHGLDTLYVDPETLSPQGKRKLLGFQATGGTIIYL